MRGFFLLPAEGPGLLLLYRHYARPRRSKRRRSEAVGTESFAQVLRRRIGIAPWRAITRAPDARLHGVALEGRLKSRPKPIPAQRTPFPTSPHSPHPSFY